MGGKGKQFSLLSRYYIFLSGNLSILITSEWPNVCIFVFQSILILITFPPIQIIQTGSWLWTHSHEFLLTSPIHIIKFPLRLINQCKNESFTKLVLVAEERKISWPYNLEWSLVGRGKSQSRCRQSSVLWGLKSFVEEEWLLGLIGKLEVRLVEGRGILSIRLRSASLDDGF